MVLVGILMVLYVLFGGMLATTWVQDHQGRAVAFRRLVHGDHGAQARQLRRQHAVLRSHQGASEGRGDHESGRPGQGSDLGILPGLRADVRHRRAAAHPDALLHRQRRQGSAQERVLRHRFHRLLLHPDLHHRFRCDPAGQHQPGLQGRHRRADRRQQHGGGAPGRRGGRQPVPRLHLGGGLRHHPRGGRRADPGRGLGRLP
ncbi:cation/acetate symporter ActP [Pseudomonas aeruginosa]|nr:cation/acetate symporter ActP [Pseudomonas aeruginosa]